LAQKAIPGALEPNNFPGRPEPIPPGVGGTRGRGRGHSGFWFPRPPGGRTRELLIPSADFKKPTGRARQGRFSQEFSTGNKGTKGPFPDSGIPLGGSGEEPGKKVPVWGPFPRGIKRKAGAPKGNSLTVFGEPPGRGQAYFSPAPVGGSGERGIWGPQRWEKRPPAGEQALGLGPLGFRKKGTKKEFTFGPRGL